MYKDPFSGWAPRRTRSSGCSPSTSPRRSAWAPLLGWTAPRCAAPRPAPVSGWRTRRGGTAGKAGNEPRNPLQMWEQTWGFRSGNSVRFFLGFPISPSLHLLKRSQDLAGLPGHHPVTPFFFSPRSSSGEVPTFFRTSILVGEPSPKKGTVKGHRAGGPSRFPREFRVRAAVFVGSFPVMLTPDESTPVYLQGVQLGDMWLESDHFGPPYS